MNIKNRVASSKKHPVWYTKFYPGKVQSKNLDYVDYVK